MCTAPQVGHTAPQLPICWPERSLPQVMHVGRDNGEASLLKDIAAAATATPTMGTHEMLVSMMAAVVARAIPRTQKNARSRRRDAHA